MHTGLPVWIMSPPRLSRPVAGSTRNGTIVSLFSLAAYRTAPEGSSVTNRGPWPSLDAQSTGVRRPFAGSTAKVPMLSWPRLDTNTKRPSAEMSISAAVLAPVNVSGTEGITCSAARAPVSAW